MCPTDGRELDLPSELPLELVSGSDSGRGEPQISQTGPSREKRPHQAHAILVFAIAVLGKRRRPLLEWVGSATSPT